MPDTSVDHSNPHESSPNVLNFGGDVLEGDFVSGRTMELALASEDEGGPEWIHVFPMEPFWHPVTGKVEPSKTLLQQFVHNFEQMKNDGLVDYEHQCMAYPPVKAPAAGWYDQLEVRDDGLWAHMKEWMRTAQAHFEAREYRYISPVFSLLARSRRTGATIGPVMVCVGLTNVPHIDGMTPVVNRIYSEEPMPNAAILVALSLAATATDEDVINAIEQLKNPEPPKPVIPASIPAALNLGDDADEAAVCSAVAGLQQRLHDAEAGGDDMVSLADHAKVMGELAQAKAERRVIDDGVAPAVREIGTRLALASESQYTEWLKTAPRVNEIEIKPPAGGGGSSTATLSEAELAMCKQTGLTPEQFIEARDGDQ